MVTAIYVLPLTAILVFLVLRVISIRRAEQISLGDAGNSKLQRACRAHGNFVEMVPYILILMLVMELQHMPAWALHIYGVILVAARMAHAWGVLVGKGGMKGRVYGTIVTALLLISGAVGAFCLALF